MKLPTSAHTSRSWRIHELTPDFTLEDVWQLPVVGGPHDLLRLVEVFVSLTPSEMGSAAARALFVVRRRLGELLRLDGPESGVGSRVPSLRDRLPADLRDVPAGPDGRALPFRSLYLTDDEWAVEAANNTVHGVLHVGWAPDESGRHRGQLAVLVKPNGPLGHLYLAFIRPFRYAFVYPAIMRELERRWQSATGVPTEGVPA